jgi:hypothetical protein
MSRCRRERGPDGKWFWIPGCIARAVNERDCTCEPRKGSNRDLAERVDKLERDFAHMCRSYSELRIRLRPNSDSQSELKR